MELHHNPKEGSFATHKENSFITPKKPLRRRSQSILQMSNHRTTLSFSSLSNVSAATHSHTETHSSSSSSSTPVLSPASPPITDAGGPSDPGSPLPEEDRDHKPKESKTVVFTCELTEKLNPLDYVRVLDTNTSATTTTRTTPSTATNTTTTTTTFQPAHPRKGAVTSISTSASSKSSESTESGDESSGHEDLALSRHPGTAKLHSPRPLSRKVAINHDGGFTAIRKSVRIANRMRGYGSIVWTDDGDSDDNICYNPPEEGTTTRTIRGGTIKRLVQYLTGCMGTTFGTDFILTYSGFMEPQQLLDMILSRYDFLECTGRDATTLIRCVNIIKLWLTLLPKDFEDDPELAAEVDAFAQRFSANSATHVMLERLLRGQRRQEIGNREFVPEPIVFEEVPLSTSWTLEDMHPEEIARQLWILEDALWKKIQPYEFMNEAWLREDKEKRAPNITEMIFASNVRTNWMMYEILSKKDIRDRVRALDKVIYVAEAALRIHNYNAVMEIYAALQSSAVHRLKRTWELLAPEAWEAFDKIAKFVSSTGNFQNYREALKNDYNEGTPVIPYLGMYLTYLTFVNQGNPNLIPDTDMINFNKWRSVSTIIQ